MFWHSERPILMLLLKIDHLDIRREKSAGCLNHFEKIGRVILYFFLKPLAAIWKLSSRYLQLIENLGDATGS